MDIQFFGAAREVTGSCFLVRANGYRVLVECGLIQGSARHERLNRDPFPFDPAEIDAVVLTHAHLDHSGRLPLLFKRGFNGNVYTHPATIDLCQVILQDAGYLNEKEAQWENRKRERKGLQLVEPLYTRREARSCGESFRPLRYGDKREILPGIRVTLRDAGHILGSAIVELQATEHDAKRTLCFSGDLGHRGAPILRDPESVARADLVCMESTYGDRLHRAWAATWQEMGEILSSARSDKGNILIPAFAVDRTQMLLYTFREHFEDWHLGDWQIFLDSPMAIETTQVYARHTRVHDSEARALRAHHGNLFDLPNLHLSRDTEDSMRINRIRAGAIVVAGSGMCTGGRIKHHLKHNIWRESTRVLIVGFQARGTPGRALVDGARHIRLWGETVQVKARVHTIGGLSAHADQDGLVNWCRSIGDRPAVALVHGEHEAMELLDRRITQETGLTAMRPVFAQRIDLSHPDRLLTDQSAPSSGRPVRSSHHQRKGDQR